MSEQQHEQALNDLQAQVDDAFYHERWEDHRKWEDMLATEISNTVSEGHRPTYNHMHDGRWTVNYY
jgi:hypothetical protein